MDDDDVAVILRENTFQKSRKKPCKTAVIEAFLTSQQGLSTRTTLSEGSILYLFGEFALNDKEPFWIGETVRGQKLNNSNEAFLNKLS